MADATASGMDWSGVSDEAPANFQKEIFSIRTRLFHGPRIVALFDFCFLKYNFYGILRLISSYYEHPSTLSESGVSIPFYFLLRRRKAGFGLALMLAKLHSR
jgi:hypothetical protein